MGKYMECSPREQHCCDPGIPTHCEAPTNEYILFLSLAHGHGRTEWQFRATRLVKKETVLIISTCNSEVVLDSTSLFALFYLCCTLRVQNVTWGYFSSEDAEGSLGCDSCCLEGGLQITTAASSHSVELCPVQKKCPQNTDLQWKLQSIRKLSIIYNF